MQIVKLADRGEARFQHLHVGERGDRLDVVGCEPAEEAIHHLAPGPEAVGRRTAALGEPGHAALEGVAVQVGQTRQRDAGDVLGAVARCVCRDRDDGAVRDARCARRAPSRTAAARDRKTARVAKRVLRSWPIGRGPVFLDNRRRCALMYRERATLTRSVRSRTAMRFDTIWLDARLATLAPGRPGSASSSAAPSRPRTAASPLPARWPSCRPAGMRPSASSSTAAGSRPGLSIATPTSSMAATARTNSSCGWPARATRRSRAPAAASSRPSRRPARRARTSWSPQALPRLDRLIAEGVTTIEIKSGYGLDLATETRMLRAARRLAR